MQPDLVVIGELNVDLIMSSVNELPALDQERIAERTNLVVGGSAAILAANAAALGMSVGFVGCAGTDAFGDFMVEGLTARGVDCSFVKRRDRPSTGLTLVYTYGSRRAMLTYPGAMAVMTLAEIPLAYVLSARHVHLSSYYLQTALRPDTADLFRMAKRAGLTTSLDTNWDPAERWGEDVIQVLKHVDVFLPDGAEAIHIAGQSTVDRALTRLARYAGAVVATCGAKGVRARRGTTDIRMPAVNVDPVDTVGAGDSFNAGFLHEYLQGAPLDHCIRQGLLASAFSTLRVGGTAAFEDIDAFHAFCAEYADNPVAPI